MKKNTVVWLMKDYPNGIRGYGDPMEKGDTCTVVKSYWENGEGHYVLKRMDGTFFESPDVFWMSAEEQKILDGLRA